jgi:hypothetical protein
MPMLNETRRRTSGGGKWDWKTDFAGTDSNSVVVVVADVAAFDAASAVEFLDIAVATCATLRRLDSNKMDPYFFIAAGVLRFQKAPPELLFDQEKAEIRKTKKWCRMIYLCLSLGGQKIYNESSVDATESLQLLFSAG